MTRTPVALFVLTAALLASCEMPFGTEPGGGEGAPTRLTDQIEIEPGLVAELYMPETVQPTDSFEARLRIENQTMRGLDLRTPSACLAYPSVYYAHHTNGPRERAEIKGTQLLCASVVTHRDIGAGQVETAVYDLQASLTDGEGTEPAPPGTYRLEICLDWTLEGREVEKVLEGQFEVAAGR